MQEMQGVFLGLRSIAFDRGTPPGQLPRQTLSFSKLRRNRVGMVLIGTPVQSARS